MNQRRAALAGRRYRQALPGFANALRVAVVVRAKLPAQRDLKRWGSVVP